MQYATINFHKYKIMLKHAIHIFKITHLHSDYFAVLACFHISVVHTTLIIDLVQNSICNMRQLSFITTNMHLTCNNYDINYSCKSTDFFLIIFSLVLPILDNKLYRKEYRHRCRTQNQNDYQAAQSYPNLYRQKRTNTGCSKAD